MNGLSVASSEEEFLRAAEECRRFGAAVIVLALPKHEGGYPTYQEKAGVTPSTGHFESRFIIYDSTPMNRAYEPISFCLVYLVMTFSHLLNALDT